MISIGKRIYSFRKALELNQNEFAKSISISQGTLSDIENDNFTPSVKTIIAVIREFNVCANWIVLGSCQHHNNYKSCPYYCRLKELNMID